MLVQEKMTRMTSEDNNHQRRRNNFYIDLYILQRICISIVSNADVNKYLLSDDTPCLQLQSILALFLLCGLAAPCCVCNCFWHRFSPGSIVEFKHTTSHICRNTKTLHQCPLYSKKCFFYTFLK